jgi:hypothetical protein
MTASHPVSKPVSLPDFQNGDDRGQANAGPKSLKLTLTSSLPRSVTATLDRPTLALVGSFLIGAKLTASAPETRGRRGGGFEISTKCLILSSVSAEQWVFVG